MFLTVLFGELLLLALEVVVLVLVLLPAPVERPLHVALRAAEVRLEEPVHGEQDDAVQVLLDRSALTPQIVARNLPAGKCIIARSCMPCHAM